MKNRFLIWSLPLMQFVGECQGIGDHVPNATCCGQLTVSSTRAVSARILLTHLAKHSAFRMTKINMSGIK